MLIATAQQIKILILVLIHCRYKMRSVWVLYNTASPHFQYFTGSASNRKCYTCTWHLHMALANDTCTWHLHVTLAHDTCTWHLHVALARGTCTWHLHMALAHCTWHLHMHMPLAHGTYTWHLRHNFIRKTMTPSALGFHHRYEILRWHWEEPYQSFCIQPQGTIQKILITLIFLIVPLGLYTENSGIGIRQDILIM